jgi:deazaflavin-dependent oxidoreductase (nitroreductase family)
MVAVIELIDRSARLRRFVRSLAGLLNPLVVPLAGRRWMPIVGVLHHRGRRSGKLYHLPLGMRRFRDGYLVPRTFGDHAQWHRNLVAGTSAEVTYRGERRPVRGGRVLDLAETGAAFPRYERALFRLLGINQFLELRSVQPRI